MSPRAQPGAQQLGYVAPALAHVRTFQKGSRNSALRVKTVQVKQFTPGTANPSSLWWGVSPFDIKEIR
ncbi:hypothetical protein AVEN_203605-1 [Araneus ventricosus]|uniref:Uncharacterized protein n=1 Tax=Araneus ventricosus TaxID=182803 RepID=A0A4Y2WCE6_ARAVE|nr:hypothetical protein AVEN_203605-1 [Araneus ventricosus]